MNQLQKFSGFKAELAIAETLEEIKFLESKAAAAAEFARRNKIGLDEQNQWGKFRIEIEAKKGEWLDRMFPKGGDRGNQYKVAKLTEDTLATEGITPNESSNARLIHNKPELRDEVIAEIEGKGEVITPSKVSAGIRKKQEAEKKAVVNKIIQGKKEEEELDEFEIALSELTEEVESIISDSGKLSIKIMKFNGKLYERRVDNIESLQHLFVLDKFKDLLIAIDTMVKYFGYKLNK
jgi:hypothetical protein